MVLESRRTNGTLRLTIHCLVLCRLYAWLGWVWVGLREDELDQTAVPQPQPYSPPRLLLR